MNPIKKLLEDSKKRMSLQELVNDLENNFLYEMQHIPVYENSTRIEIKYFEESELETYLNEGLTLYKFDCYVVMFAAVKALSQLVLDISLKKTKILDILGEYVEDHKEAFQGLIKNYGDTLAEFNPPLPKCQLLLVE